MNEVIYKAEEILNAECKFSFKWNGAPHWEFVFPNGYGASVINDGYGRESGLFELAVLDSDGHLCYDTEITDDVIGWLTEHGVYDLLEQISKFPSEEKAKK